MAVRRAVVSGQFYEAGAQQCRTQIKELLPIDAVNVDLPKLITAGIAPHAGWIFSGRLAAMVFGAIKQQQEVDTFVMFGAVHSFRSGRGLLYDTGEWETPLGAIEVDTQLGEQILEAGGDLVEVNCSAHSREHSIEVQVPFVQYMFADARIVPLMVPPVETAVQIGEAVGTVMERSDKKVVCIASTDLTHYGPSYYFTPRGSGAEALRWAKGKNDRFFIELALSMQAQQLVESARTYNSACGAGAVTAAVAAAKYLGAPKGILLAHTTSAEVLMEQFHQPSEDSVGYAAIVFGDRESQHS